jgi:hypothetical protein
MQLSWKTGGAVRVAGVVSTVFMQGQNVEFDNDAWIASPRSALGA